jgi:hypothetical protein
VSDIELDEFLVETAATRNFGNHCTLAVLRPQMTDRQWEQLRAAIGEPAITSAAIVRVLKTWGYTVNPQVIRRHRHDVCAGGCDVS